MKEDLNKITRKQNRTTKKPGYAHLVGFCLSQCFWAKSLRKSKKIKGKNTNENRGLSVILHRK